MIPRTLCIFILKLMWLNPTPTKKWQLLLKMMILKSPNLYISMTNPPIPFWELKMTKRGLYCIFIVISTDFQIKKFGFVAFF